MPTADRLQRALVQHLRDTHALTDPAVAGAFLTIGRHHFLPNLPLDKVYADEAIPTKLSGGMAISSSSQPAIMAIMLEQLEVAPGQRILEIGAGTGYNAALLGHLVGPAGRVTALDLDDDIVAAARQHLAAAGVTNVDVLQTDGAFGWPDGAPYDRIILTVGAWDIAPAWHEQLRPGGRLVLPLELGQGPQRSLALVKPSAPASDLWFESASARDCGFMRLRGAFAGPEVLTPLGPDPGLHLSTMGPPPVPPETVYAWLNAAPPALTTGLEATNREVWGGIGLWLGLRVPNFCSLHAAEGQAERGLIPCLLAFGGQPAICVAVGAIRADGLALLGRVHEPEQSVADPDDGAVSAILAQSYGPAGAELAQALSQTLAEWHTAGRPSSDGLRVRVYPRAYPYPPAAGEIVVPKRATQLVIDWPA